MSPPSDDDDATRIRPASKHDSFALPIGTRLGEFELTHHIGEGGFGIVYLAYDHTLDRSVALKEYMPSSLATRVGDKQINVRSERYRETFEAGMKSFINEAKLLARFDHPSLVKVFRFWQENGTAYMAMPYYNGVNMRDTVRALPEPPDEEWLLDLLHWLTEALAVIHAEHCYHRDLAPDNVRMLAALQRSLDRSPEPARHPEQVGAGLARQGNGRDQLERVARLWHHANLQAARRAQAGDLDRRIKSAEGIRGRDQW